MGCCFAELYGQANAFHYANSDDEDVRELESAANFGRLMAVFLWVYGLMSPLSGIIGDRVNRKWLIVGSLCVWSGVTYLMGYATTFNQLYWLRGIMGVSEALYLPAALSLIADFHKDKTRSLAVGIHMTGIICRTGYRWVRSYFCSNLFLAYHVSLVWHYRCRLWYYSGIFPT